VESMVGGSPWLVRDTLLIFYHPHRDLFDAILDRFWTAGARTGVFLAAGGWSVSILGTNVAANMIPFGSDSSMLFPKYITIVSHLCLPIPQ